MSWLEKFFDTSSVFNADRDVLFIMNDRSTENILYYSKGKLYKVGDRLIFIRIKNDEYEKRLEV